jgi:hypothetical protein
MKISKPITATYGMVTGAAELGQNVFRTANKGMDILSNDLDVSLEDSKFKLEMYKEPEFVAYRKNSIKRQIIQDELEAIKESDLDETTKELLTKDLLKAFSK